MSMYTHGRAEPVNGYPTAATSTGGQPGVVNTTGPTAGHYDATHPTVIDMRQDSHNVSNSGDAGVVPAERSAHFEVMDNVSPASSTAGPVPLAEQPIPYSNAWFVARERLQVYFAEFLGTLILVLWGEGTQAQVVASRKAPNDYLSIAWGWGVGFMLAVYVSSGISGGHINPAVTVSLAVFRKFPWRKVPGYMFAQLLGGFVGAAIIYGIYYGSFMSLENGFTNILVTGPAALVPNTVSTFFSVFIGAALLMGAISAFTDTGNNPSSPGLTPLLLGLVMVGIASSFGYSTGFVLNPARDLGPRLFLFAIGQGGKDLWLANDAYGIWTPAVGTITGALFGNLLYDLLIYKGKDSFINRNFSREGRRLTKERAAILGEPKKQDAGVVNRDRYRRDSVHHHHHFFPHRRHSIGDGQGKWWRTGPVTLDGSPAKPRDADLESGRLSGVTVTGGDEKRQA